MSVCTFHFCLSYFKIGNYFAISELWRRDRQPEESGCEDESGHQQPPHGHVWSQEKPSVRWQHLTQATQWLSYLCGGADRGCKKPPGLAWQVITLHHRYHTLYHHLYALNQVRYLPVKCMCIDILDFGCSAYIHIQIHTRSHRYWVFGADTDIGE